MDTDVNIDVIWDMDIDIDMDMSVRYLTFWLHETRVRAVR